jgi:hypothetical protein
MHGQTVIQSLRLNRTSRKIFSAKGAGNRHEATEGTKKPARDARGLWFSGQDGGAS